jgi:DNA-binding response OmpR family regulator
VVRTARENRGTDRSRDTPRIATEPMTRVDEGTVLVVDDEPQLAELYSMQLAEEYEVRTATGGPEALDLVDEEVDVALLDRRMPRMSGDELLDKLRERGIEAKVAMLTAVDPDVDIVDMPFDDYRTKPVAAAELRGLVRMLLLRASNDERSQEFFQLASKKAALETAGKEDTEEYRQLSERMAAVREEIDATLDQVDTEAAFADLAEPRV